MDHRKLGLRVYATATDWPTAFQLAERLIAVIGGPATVRECRVYPYWKFDDQYGLWLELASPDQNAAYDAVKTALAVPAWDSRDDPEDREGIWDRATHGGEAILPEATWMHLNLWGEA